MKVGLLPVPVSLVLELNGFQSQLLDLFNILGFFFSHCKIMPVNDRRHYDQKSYQKAIETISVAKVHLDFALISFRFIDFTLPFLSDLPLLKV
jgi:hypothetical protein